MSPRRAACTDANQKEIVQSLRLCGCSVQTLSAVGQGVPDLLVGFEGRNYLFEVKDGSLVPSGRKLRATQVEWHKEWKGQVSVITSVKDVRDFMEIYS